MRIRHYEVVENAKATTQNKWKPNDSNNNYKKDNRKFDHKESFQKPDKIKTARNKNDSNHSRKSFCGKPSYLSVKTERSHTVDPKSRRKSEGTFRKPISIVPSNKKSREQRTNCFKNGNGNMPNKKQIKIFDPYDNPILNYMYKTCLELERQQQLEQN